MTVSGCQAKWEEGYLLCKLSSGLLMCGVVDQVIAEILEAWRLVPENQCLSWVFSFSEHVHPLDASTQPKAKGRLRVICLIWLIELQNWVIHHVKYLDCNDLKLAIYIHQTR